MQGLLDSVVRYSTALQSKVQYCTVHVTPCACREGGRPARRALGGLHKEWRCSQQQRTVPWLQEQGWQRAGAPRGS